MTCGGDEYCGGCDTCFELQFPDYYAGGYALLALFARLHAPSARKGMGEAQDACEAHAKARGKLRAV